MHLHPIDALTGLRSALTAPLDERRDRFEQLVMEPLRPFWEPFLARFPAAAASAGSPAAEPALVAARSFGYFSPELDVDQGLAALDRLSQAGTWAACQAAAARALAALAPVEHGLALPGIQLALVLGDPARMNQQAGSYTGFGSMPGLVMVMAWPTADNLPKLPSAVAHELNHNVRFLFEPFRPDQVSVGQYLVAEGLAEAFAVELFGEAMLGPYADALTEEQVTALRPRYAEALTVSGFDEVRGYIFGDWAAAAFGYTAQGLPDFAGYTLGYRLVRAYLGRTGQTAAAATYRSWSEIVDQSRFFAG